MTGPVDQPPAHGTPVREFLAAARWFGGKGRGFRVPSVHRLGTLGRTPEGATVTVDLATVEYDDGDRELYQLPLVHYAEEQERLAHALVAEWDDPELGRVHAYDALHDRTATALWLSAFAEGRGTDGLLFHRLQGHELDLDVHSSLFSGEQSNSSVAFGEDSLMKVFRKITPGRNPDIEIHEALTLAENQHVPALYGWLEAPAGSAPGPGADAPEEPVQLAMLQQFLRTASDGWDLALASVRDLFAEADLHADEVGGDFAAESHRLGVATAEVHDALADHFPTHTWRASELTALAGAMRQRLQAAVEVVPRLGEHADALRAAYDALAGVEGPVPVQRVHGDFHLGQTLRTVKGWKIVDFEGEPAKPLAERVRPDSPWRDVAGMLRSFDYAAHAVEVDVQEEGPQIAYRALEWAERNRAAFLEGYVESSHRVAGETLSADQETLLRAYEVDKAVYEAVYEARNRPDWLSIPLGAVTRLTAPAHGGAAAAQHPHDQEASS